VSQQHVCIKHKVLAAAAPLTVVSGIGLASVGTASAATPSCGHQCIDIFSKQFGTHKSPDYVVDVLRQGEKTDQPVIAFRAADYDPAFEIEYAPFGVDTGMCMGVAATAFSGEGVTLQPCGVSARTVWIADVIDSPSTLFTGYVPAINGSDTNFSHPSALTYPKNSSPAGQPRPQLVVTNLTGFSQTSPPLNIPGPELGTVDTDQLWGADFGILKQG